VPYLQAQEDERQFSQSGLQGTDKQGIMQSNPAAPIRGEYGVAGRQGWVAMKHRGTSTRTSGARIFGTEPTEVVKHWRHYYCSGQAGIGGWPAPE
jgi:hypothetical protein